MRKYFVKELNVMPETYLEKTIRKFAETAHSQEEKGIEKYGHELQPLDNKWDWLEMAKEELVDAFKYLSAERERRDALLDVISDCVESAYEFTLPGEVNTFLRLAIVNLKKLRGEDCVNYWEDES